MDKYDVIKTIGEGTFGSVLKAKHKQSGELVAVKKMKQKYYSWEECVKLPEVAALRKFNAHPNIVKLKEVVRENNILFFVFEFLDGDMLGRMKTFRQQNGVGLPHHLVKSYTHQLLQSLQYLHRCGYFHRDLKPENILLKHGSGGKPDVIKLADFGLVKEIRARPPFTDYVSTRWYRSPEILLQDRAYSSPCDMWAVGCMISEFYTTRPLFPGTNEVDQMFKILSVLGTPTEQQWPEGYAMARKIQYKFPVVAPTPLEKVLGPHVPAEAVDLMKALLQWDPRKRLTPMQALNHPFFQGSLEEDSRIIPSHHMKGLNYGGASKAPSAPSPHYSKQVEWKQESSIKEVQNPQQYAKPSSSDTSRLPPVSIPKAAANGDYQTQHQAQSVSKAQAGGSGGGQFQSSQPTTSMSNNNGKSNNSNNNMMSASSRAKPLLNGVSGSGALPSVNSFNKKPLMPGGNSPSGAGGVQKQTSSNNTTPIGSLNSNVGGSGGGTSAKPFDFTAWQRVKDGGGPKPTSSTTTTTAGASPPQGTTRPPIAPLTNLGSHHSSSSSSGLNLPSGGRASPGANYHNVAPLMSSTKQQGSSPSVGQRNSPRTTNKDIVDQALEELLGNTASSYAATPTSNTKSSLKPIAGRRASGGSGGLSPLDELLKNTTYGSSGQDIIDSTSGTSPGGGGGGHTTTTTSTTTAAAGSAAALRDRSGVPIRRSSGAGVVVGAPISPSINTILERRKNAPGGSFQHSSSFGTKLQF